MTYALTNVRSKDRIGRLLIALVTTTAPFMLGRLASTVTGGATARPGAGFYLGPARWICPAQSNVAHNPYIVWPNLGAEN